MTAVPDPLTPEQRVAARAVNVLASLSAQSLRDLRRGGEGRRSEQHSRIPRAYLQALAEALDDAYPGALDEVAAQVEQQRAQKRQQQLAAQRAADERAAAMRPVWATRAADNGLPPTVDEALRRMTEKRTHDQGP